MILKNILVITDIIICIYINLNNINCTEINTNQYLSKQLYKKTKNIKNFSEIAKNEYNKSIVVNLFQNTNNENNNASINRSIYDAIDDINNSYDNEIDFEQLCCPNLFDEIDDFV